ncbi:hypothetical protein BKA70DRAFT_1556257 [Coprinopsis sp. MPI-PUGE-AT-0042]|nr:hypothetical protein BKA70DRAFT_1556257 [Coprinopsis sp. MPI-PUGE-AT-0042]
MTNIPNSYPPALATASVKHVRLEGGTVNLAGRDVHYNTAYHYPPASVHNHFPGAQYVNNGTNHGTMYFGSMISPQIPPAPPPSGTKQSPDYVRQLHDYSLAHLTTVADRTKQQPASSLVQNVRRDPLLKKRKTSSVSDWRRRKALRNAESLTESSRPLNVKRKRKAVKEEEEDELQASLASPAKRMRKLK